MSLREQSQPRRAPLLWLLLPFLLGIILAHYYPGSGSWWIIPPVIILFFFLLLGQFKEKDNWWYLLYPLIIFAISTIYHSILFERMAPKDRFVSEWLPARESFVEIEPVQIFQTPPYANRYSGLGYNIDEDLNSLWYYSAPGRDRSSPLLTGYAYEMRGVAMPIDQLTQSGGFLSYLQSRGVQMGIRAISPPDMRQIVSPFEAGLALLRKDAISALRSGQPDDSLLSRIYIATVLGMRSGLTSEQKRVFRETGTAHLFAISGLHVGLIGLFLFIATRFLPVRESVRVFSALSILLGYVLITGSAPSAVRAFLMIGFLWCARCIGRDYRAESALAVSAFVVLLYDPTQLFSLGFQLSYCVVFSILIFGVPLADRWIEDTKRDPWLPGDDDTLFHTLRKWFFGSLAISLSAFIGSTPIIVSQFGILPLSSIILNLLLLPLATLLLAYGFISLALGLTPLSFLSAWVNYGAWPILDTMRWLVDQGAKIPLSHFSIDMHTAWLTYTWLGIWFLVAFWVSTKPRFRYRYLFLPVLVMIVALSINLGS